MKLSRTVGISTVLLFFATTVPGAVGRGWQDERQDKPKQQDKQRGKAQKQDEGDKQRAKPREEHRGQPATPQRREQPAAREQQPPPSSHDRGEAPSRDRERIQLQRERGGGAGAPGRAVARPPDRYPREVRNERQARAWQEQHGWQRPGVWREHDTWHEHRAQRWDRDHRTWLQRGGYGGFYIPGDHFRLHFGIGHYFRLRTRPIIAMGYPRFQYGGYWFMLVDPWPEFWAADWYATDDLYVDYDDGYYLYNRRHPGVAIAISVVF
jgi:hypothetical protein